MLPSFLSRVEDVSRSPVNSKLVRSMTVEGRSSSVSYVHLSGAGTPQWMVELAMPRRLYLDGKLDVQINTCP